MRPGEHAAAAHSERGTDILKSCPAPTVSTHAWTASAQWKFSHAALYPLKQLAAFYLSPQWR